MSVSCTLLLAWVVDLVCYDISGVWSGQLLWLRRKEHDWVSERCLPVGRGTARPRRSNMSYRKRRKKCHYDYDIAPPAKRAEPSRSPIA